MRISSGPVVAKANPRLASLRCGDDTPKSANIRSKFRPSACNCWLADCYQLQGREADARASLERLLDVRNALGLLSEEYNIAGKRLVGNFPQVLSHVALITTALGLSGEVFQRGGG